MLPLDKYKNYANSAKWYWTHCSRVVVLISTTTKDGSNGMSQAQYNCNLHLSPLWNWTPREHPGKAFSILHLTQICFFSSTSRPSTFAYYIDRMLLKCLALGLYFIQIPSHLLFLLFLWPYIHDFLCSSLVLSRVNSINNKIRKNIFWQVDTFREKCRYGLIRSESSL